jgi:nucleotide sugar dehydrogenase
MNKIGFIGQGWIGKHLAENLERRHVGDIIRYSLDDQYKENKDKIKECDIVFIAIPTPTTPDGVDSKALFDVIKLVGENKIAVIKSTILPHVARKLWTENPNRNIIYNPEFLNVSTAKHDTDHPDRNIIGVPDPNADVWTERAKKVLSILPGASVSVICSYEEASFIKYGGNCFLYFKLMFFNILHDLAKNSNVDWDVISMAIANDPRIGSAYTKVVDKGGRGAGGECLIKDLAAMRMLMEQVGNDPAGLEIMRWMEVKNRQLLEASGKDLDLLKGVYGE